MPFSHDVKKTRLDPGKESASGASTPRGRPTSRALSRGADTPYFQRLGVQESPDSVAGMPTH
eukprot:924825-Alexandrium_andersonii.AAC.1